MYPKHFRLLSVFIILLMAAMACNLGVAEPTATPIPTTVIGEDIPTATDTAIPTETATLEPTPTPTETPNLEPTVTPTVGMPVAEVVKETTCRTGPAGNYALVVALKVGDAVDVVARDLGGGFVFVQLKDQPDMSCWVLENTLTITGDVTPLPAFTPQVSPTLPPSFTVKYKAVDNCHGKTFARFEVVNTGTIQFRSAYIKATNRKNGEVVQHAVNAFDLNDGCDIQINIAPLTPGKTGYLETEVFSKASIKGQKILAVFQLCSEQGLKGSCATFSLEFVAK